MPKHPPWADARARFLLLATAVTACRRAESPPEAFRSDVPLATRREILVEGQPEWLLAEDLDGDGRCDLAAASFAPGLLRLWRGGEGGIAGSGQARVGETLALGDYPLQPVAVPWRKNGGPPLVAIASRADRALRIVDGRDVSVVMTVPLPAIPRSIAVGDVDGDGVPEIVLPTDGRVLLLVRSDRSIETRRLSGDLPRCARVLAGGAGIAVGFQDLETLEILPARAAAADAPIVLELGAIPRDLLEADLDGDGDLELAVVGGERCAWVFGLGIPGGGAGWLASPARARKEFRTDPIAVSVTARDLDGDGAQDLVLVPQRGAGCESWVGFRDFPPRLAQSSYAGQGACGLALGDFDCDGHVDLAVADRDACAVSLLQGVAGGRFAGPRQSRVGSFPVSLDALDLDGRGSLEIAAIAAKDSALSVVRDGLEVARIPLGPSPRALACGDLDADGRAAEAACIVRDASSSRIVALFLDPAGAERRRVETPLGRGGSDLLFAAWPGSSPSLFAADPETDELVWLEAAEPTPGETALRTRARLPLPSGPRAIAAIQLDDDAEPELAVALGGPGPQTGVALLELRDGRFGLSSRLEIRGAPCGVAAGDFDGDGREDLAVLVLATAAGPAGTVMVWLAAAASDAGEATFLAADEAPTGGRPQALVARDLDGDGRAEILVACLESHVVNLWKFRGGRLLRCSDVGAGLGCIDVRCADLDGDSRPEILVANSASDEVSVIAGPPR